jgi:peptide-methionine (S)-S-oxide reductase
MKTTNVSRTIRLAGLIAGLAAGLCHDMNASDASKTTNATERATYGGGCFWCVEAIFQRLDGVKSVASGYAGGKTDNPTYKEICTGETGHAEVIQIEYDPKKISYQDLLDVFWQAHDPTTLNRQGADRGTQYRSIILYQDEGQKQLAEAAKKKAAGQFRDPIVTEIVPLTKFYKAEAYHQNYYNENQNAPYCQFVIRPKLDKLLKKLSKAKP